LEYRPASLEERALLHLHIGDHRLPKAANVSHFRVMQWSHWFAGLMDVQPSDRMYNCLPLYHSVGGVVATGATLGGGGAVVLRERFSASSFLEGPPGERCTLFQYIGELCRYLVNSPRQPQETQHALRLVCGNGLRSEVWAEFQEALPHSQILEYYASTEGNFSLYNCEGRPGAIGRIPPFLSHRAPVAIVSSMLTRQLPRATSRASVYAARRTKSVRRSGRSSPRAQPRALKATPTPKPPARKSLRDVFAQGDAWYRSGDLLRRDEQASSISSTGRATPTAGKGENISTTEVAGVIAGAPGVAEAAGVRGRRAAHGRARGHGGARRSMKTSTSVH